MAYQWKKMSDNVLFLNRFKLKTAGMSTLKNKDTNEDTNLIREFSTIVISIAYLDSSIPAGRTNFKYVN